MSGFLIVQIVVAVVAGVIVLVREAFPKGKITATLLALAIVLLLAEAALAIWNEHSESRAEHCKQYSGVFRSPTEAIGDKVLLRSGGDIPATMESLPNKELRILLGADEIRIKLVDDRPVVTFPFRDSTGAVIGYVKDNEWHVSAQASYEHNFNENAFEVIGHKGEILLQMELHGEVVRVAGTFYGPAGEAKANFGPYLGAGRRVDGRLFRYPSCRHPAELQE
jgi:hypothetical protein